MELCTEITNDDGSGTHFGPSTFIASVGACVTRAGLSVKWPAANPGGGLFGWRAWMQRPGTLSVGMWLGVPGLADGGACENTAAGWALMRLC